MKIKKYRKFYVPARRTASGNRNRLRAPLALSIFDFPKAPRSRTQMRTFYVCASIES